MPAGYPSRDRDRWKHALLRPLTPDLEFETIELMRGDLFEYLDVLTTSPYKEDTSGNTHIQLIAERLKEMTPIRAEALERAIDDGRIEVECAGKRVPKCGPVSAKLWHKLGKRWDRSVSC